MRLAILVFLACPVRAEVRCVVVDQSSVMAGELAVAIPEFRAIAADRHLLWAPAPGLTRWLRAAELHEMAAREGVTVAAGSSICLQRKTIVFSEDEVLSALRERLPAGSDIQIVEYCRMPMMSGRLRFEARPGGRPAGANRPLHWKGVVIGDDRKTAPFWASVQVRIERRVVRAARLVPAKAILTKEDLVEKIEQSTLVEAAPAPVLSDLVGKETSRRIGPQELLNPSWLRTPQMVRRGQTVRVMVESGQALLALDARALSGGDKGDILLMKNDESGKSFRAEVTGPGKALVRMEVLSK